jgi:uncharacterized damage-inducible protein DinB
MLIDFLTLMRVTSLPALAAIVAAAPSQALEWQKEIVFEGAAKPSLAVGADGLPRVAFLLEAMPGFVAFAQKSDGGWTSVLEQMVHQCVSEDFWFRRFLDIDVGAPPLPGRREPGRVPSAVRRDSGKRLEALRTKDESWWEDEVDFFEVRRSRARVMVRYVAHGSHHHVQQMAMLRMLQRATPTTAPPPAARRPRFRAQDGGPTERP